MIIEAKSLKKYYKVPYKSGNFIKDIFMPKYKTIKAVDGINLEIRKGETVGYIGLNGAGKSTTIKLLTGILTPSYGYVKLFGRFTRDNSNRIENNKKMGVVFGQKSNLWYDLPVIDSYMYFKDLYEIPQDVFESNLNMLKEKLGLGELLDRPVRKLSLGQKMKCEVGAVFLHNPEIIFLDEPTIGLDIFARDNLLDCIQELKKMCGTTIFLTTHNMDEISKLCDRIIVLDKGNILYNGNLENIKEIVGDYQEVTFYIDNYHKNDNCMGKYDEYIFKRDENLIKLNINKNNISVADVMRYYFDNYDVKDVNIENSKLEHLIKKLYGEMQCE